MSYRIERRDNTTASKHLNKEEMQQAKYGILRRAVSCDMTYLDRRDHYHSIYYNKMVCAPGFEIDRTSGGLSYKVGDYYLSSLLGRGGGGSVYEGRHRKTNKRVAIKVVTKSRTEETRAAQGSNRRGSAGKDANASVAYAKKIQRTRKEYTVMSHLRDHRHITKLLDVVENDKAICLQKGRLSLYESWFLFRQLVSAVAHAHAQGFVHRDIKPENVFLSEDKKTATLGDWGFADVWCSFKDLKEGVGSLNYCSPEIVGGLPYTGPEVVMNIKTSNFVLTGSCEADPLLYDLLSRLLNPNTLERAKMADLLEHRWFRNGPTLAHIKDRRKRTGSATNVLATNNRHRTRVN
ncbi:protein kinase domain containing protein [Acanthamoeba castellanii str. Neff]|uniref:Protein kinase domain containing protein n=1 Tax=Acanthamoeba castellanii (strain ATCC 30010 / Neff) TaxID=1257118 RepID=L8GPR6_ACACF|nr:protein kinase domain containing protein [Acanthamoeba castellanii str. Neff]ELR15000.1 protein kinase domain containing protein [Acanthamoeba castellanii str. Neff]